MGRPRKKLSKPKVVDDTELAVYNVPMTDIYYDAEFNCRDEVLYETVVDLAASIKERGLVYPLVLWEREDLPEGKPYQIVAGHRRFRAFEYLQREKVPSFIRTGISPREAAIVNLEENLARTDLNIVEEAKALQALFPDGGSLRTISKEIRQSERWVQSRQRVLLLPTEIQHMLVAGRIPKTMITQVWNVFQEGGASAAVKACRDIEKAREGHFVQYNKLPSYLQLGNKKRPTRADVMEKASIMLEGRLSGIGPRMAAYCAGYLPEEDIIKDIETELAKGDMLASLKKKILALEKRIRKLEGK